MVPVFIIGCPRSGSTMLGAMLGNHPDAICLPEAQFIVDLMPESDPLAAMDAASLLESIERHWRFGLWSFSFRANSYALNGAAIPYRTVIEWLIREYAMTRSRTSPRLWIDQSLFVSHTGKLLQHFPNARFIHLIRDGRAVAASIIPLPWGPNAVHTAARLWKDHLAYGFAADAVLGGNRVIRVHYEQMVADAEGTMRRLSSFLGIDFCPAMLMPTGLDLPNYTRRQHALIGCPPDPRRIDAWRGRLTNREIEIFEALTGDLLHTLGYQALSPGIPRPPAFIEKIKLALMDRLIRIPNRIRNRARRRKFVQSAGL